jgi:hypothetical protein
MNCDFFLHLRSFESALTNGRPQQTTFRAGISKSHCASFNITGSALFAVYGLVSLAARSTSSFYTEFPFESYFFAPICTMSICTPCPNFKGDQVEDSWLPAGSTTLTASGGEK